MNNSTRKRKKKSGKSQADRLMNLLAAFLNLVTAILLFIEKLTEQRRGRESSPQPADLSISRFISVPEGETPLPMLLLIGP